MYRTSSDRRFYKIKKDIRSAFVQLVLERDHFTDISITEVSDLADINRKTFYLHYDSLDDILTEYADDMSEDLMQSLYGNSSFSTESLFMWMDLHRTEHPFFRKLSTQDKLLVFDGKCRNTLVDYFQSCLFTGKNMSDLEIRIVSSSGAYFMALSHSWLTSLRSAPGSPRTQSPSSASVSRVLPVNSAMA